MFNNCQCLSYVKLSLVVLITYSSSLELSLHSIHSLANLESIYPEITRSGAKTTLFSSCKNDKTVDFFTFIYCCFWAISVFTWCLRFFRLFYFDFIEFISYFIRFNISYFYYVFYYKSCWFVSKSCWIYFYELYSNSNYISSSKIYSKFCFLVFSFFDFIFSNYLIFVFNVSFCKSILSISDLILMILFSFSFLNNKFDKI